MGTACNSKPPLANTFMSSLSPLHKSKGVRFRIHVHFMPRQNLHPLLGDSSGLQLAALSLRPPPQFALKKTRTNLMMPQFKAGVVMVVEQSDDHLNLNHRPHTGRRSTVGPGPSSTSTLGGRRRHCRSPPKRSPHGAFRWPKHGETGDPERGSHD